MLGFSVSYNKQSYNCAFGSAFIYSASTFNFPVQKSSVTELIISLETK